MWPQSKSVLNKHPKRVYTKFRMDWVISCHDDGSNQLFSVILWPIEGQIGPMWTEIESVLNIYRTRIYRKFGMDWIICFWDNVFATRWPKWSQRGPKVNQCQTLTQQVYTAETFGMDWVIIFQIMAWTAILVIFGPLTGRHLANMATKQVNSEYLPRKFIHLILIWIEWTIFRQWSETTWNQYFQSILSRRERGAVEI